MTAARAIVAAVVLLIFLLGGIVAYVAATQFLKIPGPLEEEKIIVIAPKSGSRAIAAQLDAEGIIDHPALFMLGAVSAKLKGTGPLMAGEYAFQPRVSVADIIMQLQSGKTYQRKITVAEGLTVSEVVALLNAETALQGGTVDTLPPEGSLLPETYYFSRGDSRAVLLQRMQDDMKKTAESLWETRNADLPVQTLAEAMVLASIVEKETGINSERARVAGVFVNRLKTGMPLQSDPTVIYAVTAGKSKLERGITRKDLETVSPYNTYLNTGLPPSPIANPGKAAIEAVMNPEAHRYFYFVADGTGGHVFAETLATHNANVAKWRQIEREQKSKTTSTIQP